MSGNGEKVGMVERVAAAIIRRNDFDFYMSADEAKAFARAAIEAMREPTEEILEAGYNAPTGAWSEHVDNRHELIRARMQPAWRAMIDAALSASREEG